MNSSRRIINYYRLIYKKSNKWLMPLIGWAIFIYLNYSVMPQEYTSTMLNSATIMFLLMAWTVQTFLASLDGVLEQIVVTRLSKKQSYWAQPVIFVGWLSFIFSLVGMTLPVFLNIIQGQGLFRRAVSFEEMVCSFFIHLLFCLLGGLIALIIQPRYFFNDAKISNILLLLVGLISIVGNTMAEKIPGFQFVVWLFPPLSKVIAYFLEGKDFTMMIVSGQLISCFIYLAVLIFIYRHLRQKYLYE